MILERLLSPGLWLFRQLRLGQKVGVLALLVLPPGLLLAAGQGGGQVGWGGAMVLLTAYLLLCLQRSLAHDLGAVAGALDEILRGNLQVDLPVRGRDEFAALAATTHRIGRAVSAMVADVRSNAAFVAHAGKSLAGSNRELADRTEQQAANLEQTAASVTELSSTVQGSASAASQASVKAAEVRDEAEHGASSMATAVASVEAIQGSARRMDEIVGVIDGLAFQTNILALNAAVEAARAGESGRGFAVVASEVRSLAQRSATSAKEIRQLIATSSSQVQASVGAIRNAGSHVSQIFDGIREVADNMARISASTSQQSTALSEISSAVQQLDEITQRNAQMVERAVKQAAALEGRAGTLVQGVAAFKLQQGSAEEAVALVERAVAQRQRSGTRQAYLRDLTAAANGFHDRDMYVFALDRAGCYQAFGGNPKKVGTRVQDIPGIDGQGLLDAILEQAAQEPGWVEYAITNPSTGRVQTKMSYVCALEDLVIGCGVYKNLAGS